jgi:hypothetical protein
LAITPLNDYPIKEAQTYGKIHRKSALDKDAEIAKTPWYQNSPVYLANHYFYFVDIQVDLDKLITILVGTADNREHTFYFNLSNIK